MGSYWSADKYYKKAVSEGFRARAAYKLLDIQERFKIIRPDDNILDLGAAPGSWLQACRTLTEGCILGVDLNPITPIEGVITIKGDFSQGSVQQKICSITDDIGIVLCDASPHLSGQKSYDQARTIALGEDALSCARKVLHPGGNFVIKSFQGEMFPELLKSVKNNFRSVHVYRSRASRKGSTEVYIVAKSFKGN